MTHLLQTILHLDQTLFQLALQYGHWIYALLFIIIFCETGLVVTAVLPGDSLLFAAGAIAARGVFNFPLLAVLLIIAAFLGNISNYWIGRLLGNYILTHAEKFHIKRQYFDRAHAFYEKHGGKTVILARFIPIIRTFVPFVAGISIMNHHRFSLYNLIGAVVWVLSLLGASYYFGNLPFVQQHFSSVIMAIVIISILPMAVELVRGKLTE